MIGVDTNVLIRLVVADEESQHARARDFFGARSEADPAYISALVIFEFAWALTRLYDYSNDQVADVVLALTESPDIVVEKRDLAIEAAHQSRAPKVQFADALIAQLGIDANCTAVVTFDKNAAKRIPGMELIA